MTKESYLTQFGLSLGDIATCTKKEIRGFMHRKYCRYRIKLSNTDFFGISAK